MIGTLFPKQADNSFQGRRAALCLLALFVALKFVMSVNSIFNTAAVATGGDGLPLTSFGDEAARAVLMLFALMSLGQLMIVLTAFAILVRYRSLVPFIYLLLIGEHLARRLIIQSYAVARTDGTPVGAYVNYGLLALLMVGLVLSLVPVRTERRAQAVTGRGSEQPGGHDAGMTDSPTLPPEA